MGYMDDVMSERNAEYESNIKIEQVNSFRFFLDRVVCDIEKQYFKMNCLPHWQNQLEILYFVYGAAKVHCGENEYDVSPGDIVIVNPKYTHYISTDEEVHYWVLIPSEGMLKVNGLNFDNILFREYFRDGKAVEHLMNIKNAKDEEGPYADAKIKIAVLNALIYFAENYSYETENLINKNIPDFMIKALEYVELNLDKKITVEELSSYVNVSRYHLMREFKRITNRSFVQYVHFLKCRKSELLLRKENKLSIEKISEICGFDDEKYFYKVFKKMYGFTPKQYREEFGETDKYRW